MSQKSILSFFQKQNIKTSPVKEVDSKEPKDELPEKKETKAIDPDDVENSPDIKRKRKRIVFLASDDEDEVQQSPKKEKMEIEPTPEKKRSKSPENDVSENEEDEPSAGKKEDSTPAKKTLSNVLKQAKQPKSGKKSRSPAMNKSKSKDEKMEDEEEEKGDAIPAKKTLSNVLKQGKQTKSAKKSKSPAAKKEESPEEKNEEKALVEEQEEATPAKRTLSNVLKQGKSKSAKKSRSPAVKKSESAAEKQAESPEGKNEEEVPVEEQEEATPAKRTLSNVLKPAKPKSAKKSKSPPAVKKIESAAKKQEESPEGKNEEESPVEEPEEATPAKRTLSNVLKQGKSKSAKKSKSPAVKKSETPAEKKEAASTEKTPSKPNAMSAFFTSKNSSNTEPISDEYNPDKKNYHPIDDASWKRGERVPYMALAKTLKKIEETSARLKIIEILANYFRSVIVLSESDLLPSIYLCLNSLGPAYEGLELGMAETYLMKAIAQCTGRTVEKIKADIASTGDLGIVAEQSRSNQKLMFRPAPLTVQNVFNQLTAIAKFSGSSSMSKKVDKVASLFVACRDCEARFVIRSLAGKMRIGLAEQSLLQALAVACTTTPTNQEYPPEILNASDGLSAETFKKKVDEEALILKTTYCECPNYNQIVPVLLEGGIKALPENCKITPGVPIKPMLAQPTKGAREVLERFENLRFTCEWKYDGERAQIHILEDGKVKIFSRNQEDNTSKYPDIISGMSASIKSEVKSCILDTEAVAWDREQKKIMPFQVLSTRKRKDASESEIKVQVCVFLFDLLYLNGESLIQKPLLERRELLKETFQEVEGKFLYVTSLDTNTMEEVQECLEGAVKGNCEGLMVKTLDSEATYEIAKRSRNWLKLKKDYLEGVGDTLDLVVIGGYLGKGKRTGQYGGFLLASYDADNEEYQAICKIGTGFTDEMLAKHAEFLKEHVIPTAKPYYRHDPSLEPDHWFDAVQVWEVKCADLSLSPVYHAAIGLVDKDKGISLRFPRFLKIRDDKNVEQATSSQQVAELYKNQDQIKNQTNNTNAFNEEDF